MTGEVEDALRRARTHLRSATLEGLEAASALLDAAVGTAGIEDSDPRSFVGELRSSLNDLLAAIRTEGALQFPTAFAEPILAALDAEIARWEGRSANDEASRPVLRSFLALRELLWELGVRPSSADPGPGRPQDQSDQNLAKPNSEKPAAADANSSARPEPRRTRDRVQRFDIE